MILYFKFIYIDRVFIFFLVMFGWKWILFFVGLIVLLCCVWWFVKILIDLLFIWIGIFIVIICNGFFNSLYILLG